jgi:hypothetical protein
MQTKRAKTGFAGEYFIYSQLLKEDKNCFITLGNAKAVDLIIIDKNKKAHTIDVKSTSTLMNNTHKHPDFDPSSGKISRWQLPISIFWQTHYANQNKTTYEYADFYIFHNIHSLFQNIIVTADELCTVMHRRIDQYLQNTNSKEILPKHLCNWDVCDYCFHEFRQYNNWNKLT